MPSRQDMEVIYATNEVVSSMAIAAPKANAAADISIVSVAGIRAAGSASQAFGSRGRLIPVRGYGDFQRTYEGAFGVYQTGHSPLVNRAYASLQLPRQPA